MNFFHARKMLANKTLFYQMEEHSDWLFFATLFSSMLWNLSTVQWCIELNYLIIWWCLRMVSSACFLSPIKQHQKRINRRNRMISFHHQCWFLLSHLFVIEQQHGGRRLLLRRTTGALFVNYRMILDQCQSVEHAVSILFTGIIYFSAYSSVYP